MPGALRQDSATSTPAALDLRQLPPELQAALERAWPAQPESQRRALLAPAALGGPGIWPRLLWPWRRAAHWWRPGWAREMRAASEAFFRAHVQDIRGAPRSALLFDVDQPFFSTPWTSTPAPLRSPAPHAFSDVDYWYLLQQVCGGEPDVARDLCLDWAARLAESGSLTTPARRAQWLHDEMWRYKLACHGDFL